MDLTPFKSRIFPQLGRTAEKEFSSLQREMNDVLDNFFGRKSAMSPQIYDMSMYPAIDFQDKEDCYLVEAELPGMNEDEIELDFHNNILVIKGERKSEFSEKDEGFTHTERYCGSFRRDIPFEDEVDANKIKAELRQGILHIELMKKERTKNSHKKIAIQK